MPDSLFLFVRIASGFPEQTNVPVSTHGIYERFLWEF
jgi:hypothetical protein